MIAAGFLNFSAFIAITAGTATFARGGGQSNQCVPSRHGGDRGCHPIQRTGDDPVGFWNFADFGWVGDLGRTNSRRGCHHGLAKKFALAGNISQTPVFKLFERRLLAFSIPPFSLRLLMNKTLIGLVCTLLLTTVANGDETATKKRKRGNNNGVGAILQQLKSVDLTDEQTEKIKAMSGKLAEEMKAAREKVGLTQEIMQEANGSDERVACEWQEAGRDFCRRK